MSSRHDRKTAKLNEIVGRAAELKERNDCAVKALAVILDCPYDEAHWLLKRKGRKNRRGTRIDKFYDAIKSGGYRLENVSSQYASKTVRTLGREVSHRDFLLIRTRNHVLVVRDGLIYDWTEGRRHRQVHIFRIHRNREHTF